jgi:hypothetical protein
MKEKSMTLPFSNQYFSGTAGRTQGGWVFQATELRCGMSLTYLGNTIMLYGGGQWGSPGGEGPYGEGEGAQIYAQYSPPSGSKRVSDPFSAWPRRGRRRARRRLKPLSLARGGARKTAFPCAAARIKVAAIAVKVSIDLWPEFAPSALACFEVNLPITTSL